MERVNYSANVAAFEAEVVCASVNLELPTVVV